MKDLVPLPPAPSRFQVNDDVVANFGAAGLIAPCRVAGIHFGNGKIHYDLAIQPFKEDGGPDSEMSQEIKFVDSYFVEHPNDRFIGKSNLNHGLVN